MVDALASGASVRKYVEVQVLSSAPYEVTDHTRSVFSYGSQPVGLNLHSQSALQPTVELSLGPNTPRSSAHFVRYTKSSHPHQRYSPALCWVISLVCISA